MKKKTVGTQAATALSILAFLAFLSAASAGAVPDIQGAWEGTLAQTGWGVHRGESPKSVIVLKITRVNGAYQVSLANLGWGTQDQFDTFTYNYPGVHGGPSKDNGTCIGQVDPSGERISGTLTQNGQTCAMVIRRTTHPTPFSKPLTDAEFAPRAGSALQGFWAGRIGRGESAIHFQIAIAEASDGTFRADFYCPNRHANRQPTAVSYDGTTVKLMPMDGYGMFEGRLRKGGKEMVGEWIQNGQRTATIITPPPPAPVLVQVDSQTYDQYVGQYRKSFLFGLLHFGPTLCVSHVTDEQGNHLVASILSSGTISGDNVGDFLPVSSNKFVVNPDLTSGIQLTFVRPGKRKAKGIIVNWDGKILSGAQISDDPGAGLCCAYPGPDLINNDGPNGDKVDNLVLAEMKKEHIPGVALAVVEDGRVVRAQSYGFADVERKALVSTNTRFRIASDSKQFVATAIMMLVEEGKLSLDDPVSKYLDGTPRQWKKITIRHLLTHTSGIPDYINENIPPLHPWLSGYDQGVLNALARRPLHFAPGTDWRYSNSNYHLLGMIIRKVTGESYSEFLRERIFEPLGMTQTCVSPLHGSVPGLAVGYDWSNNYLQFGDTTDPEDKAYAGGGIISTASDMAKWGAALDSDKLLKRSSLEQMWTPVTLNDGMLAPYGFGWGTCGRSDGRHLLIEHGGNFSGFSSDIYCAVDDHVAVTVLDNRFSSTGAAGIMAEKIARLYVWKGPDYKPIPDNEPEMSARFRDILDRADHGKLQRTDCTAAEWADWNPWQRENQLEGKANGQAQSLTLVQRSQENGMRSYRYRIRYKFGTVLVHIVIDAQNKIALWTIEDIDLN